MNIYTTKLLSKLLRDPFVIEISRLRSLHKLSCSDFAVRVRVSPSAKPCAHLRFRYVPAAIAKCPVQGLSHEGVVVLCSRNYVSEGPKSGPSNDRKSLVEARESPYAHLTPAQKVKEAGKDMTYLVVVVVGIAITGFMFYMIGSELFSSQSPSGIYGDALVKCQKDIEVTSALGEPIKGYGETTRRGRRRHVSHTEFEVNGVPHMRMRFYIEGLYRKATVHVEVQKGESGKYDYRYLVVETEGFPHRTFILEDNR